MKVYKADEVQQEKIREFFKKETTYFPNQVMLKFVACILVFVSFFLNIIPCLEYEKDEYVVVIMGFMLFAFGIFEYASKYSVFAEPLTKKVVSITELTRYLPVNTAQFTIFRIKKILKPCIIAAVVVIAFRLLISFVAHGTASILDVLLPVGFMIVWPVLVELTRGVSISRTW